MHDHDQRLKMLIKEFFAEFLQLFFRDWANRFDLSQIEWLEQEVFPDPPQGKRRALDLVAKLPLRQGLRGQRPGEPEQWLALVHIEIESPDRATPIRWRMCQAYVNLRDKHGLPVLPIVLFLNVGLKGIGVDVYEEHFWELRPVRSEFLYVGLPALDAVEYVQGDNWLGVALAALMKITPERAAWLGAEALRRILGAPLTDQKRFLLGECVQAYLPLDDEQQRVFGTLIASEPYQGVQAMNTTWYEKGIEKGVEQGIAKGGREMVQGQLEERFGHLSSSVSQRLDQMSVEDLARLSKALLRASSLKELGLE